MSECSGNPSNCTFCGNSQVDCAKDSVSGCSANPASCDVCKGVGCVAVECTGDVKTCKACMGNFQTCRKSEVSPGSGAAEGVEKVRKAQD